jgi:hypothetical protein
MQLNIDFFGPGEISKPFLVADHLFLLHLLILLSLPPAQPNHSKFIFQHL